MSIRKMLKWMCIILPIVNVLSLWEGMESFSSWLPGELVAIAVSLGVLYFCYGRKSTCPSCRKIFALKKTKEEVIGQEDVSVLVETKMRDNQQKVVGTGEQYVPGVKTTYREYYTCKYCGETFTKDYTKKTPKV